MIALVALILSLRALDFPENTMFTHDTLDVWALEAGSVIIYMSYPVDGTKVGTNEGAYIFTGAF
jgi:hypothetical protein